MPIGVNIRSVLAASLLAILLLSSASSFARNFEASNSAGTIIYNQADASYRDSEGTTFTTVSPLVTVTVLAVAALTVSPKETAPSANVGPHERITRTFRICNTGNVSSDYTITQAEVNAPSVLVNLFFDNDVSGTVTPGDAIVTVGSTLSPVLAPGSCLGVLAVVDTNDAPPDSLLQIHLTALAKVTNTANAAPQDSGTIINSVGRGPIFTSPTNAALPPLKEVNGSGQAIVVRGTPFTYTIAFRNSGDVTARNLVLSDDLPGGIDYVANSLHLEHNGSKDLTDAEDADEGFVRAQHIELRLAELAPNEQIRLTFRAQINSSATTAVGLINFARVMADNAAVATTNSAVVLTDPFGTVFAGRAGASVPIPGASVAVFSDQSAASLLPFVADQGFAPNASNANPFLSDGLGHFSFFPSAAQLGAAGSPARYFVRIQAERFVTRMIELDLTAKDAGLFSMTAHALDSQPLAIAGGFTLVREDVSIQDLACVAFNVPMFEQHGLEISKSVDGQRVEIGDVVTYRVEVNNPTLATVSNVVVHDRLPPSFHYVPGTARVNIGSAPEQSIEPQEVNGELLFQIAELGPGAHAHLLYRVRVGVNAREGDAENVAIAIGMFPSGERTESGTARATVRIGGGAFSTRQVILGRVFEDVNRNGFFDEGDKPVPGVRLYLTSGQSVITDSEGLYNFPALNDGSQVVALDPVTLAPGYLLADGGRLSGRSWTRLLRTPIGGGAMLRQNFVLVRSPGSSLLAGKQETKPAAETLAPGESKTTVPEETKKPAIESASPSPSLSGSPNASAPTVAGTYEFASNETIEPMAPGAVKILAPAPDEVVMMPALEVTARVALDWTVKLEVNGEQISEKNIGVKRVDKKNQITTLTFVSIGVRPGPNRIRVTAIGPDGKPGQPQEVTALGRGPAERLEIVPERTAIQAGGRDSTLLKIRALDKWGHPAADGQIAVESSLGHLQRIDDKPAGEVPTPSPTPALGTNLTRQVDDTSSTQSSSQLFLQLEGGEAIVKLIGPGAAGDARLHASTGQVEAQSAVRIMSETRPTILVGLAEMTFGQSVPEVNLHGDEGTRRNRLSFFYSGHLWKKSMLSLAYDSARPINRVGAQDRLFQQDPLERVYPLYGDSSTRYEAAPSNSKLYLRIDHGRSYGMFGDLDSDMSDLRLGGYTRRLTGVKLHLENSGGDFVSLTGARPTTSFARDVFPAGGLSLLFLSHSEVLAGSETVSLETRDRRNPEIIISRETLVRSIDYNLNPNTGEFFLLRNISTFDAGLNLTQIVVTYEHRANGLSSSVYTARARKTFKGLGLKLGFSTVLQRQEAAPDFFLGGVDGEQNLPRHGMLRFAWATSRGETETGVSVFGFGSGDSKHDGNAYNLELKQPLGFDDAVVHALVSGASAGFLNPFGSTVTPGSRRGEVGFDFKPRPGSLLHFTVIEESNKTENVDNRRLTFSFAADQTIKERVRLHLGYDHRSFTDDLNNHSTVSNLITAGAQVQLTDKIDVAVKREQNLGEADPTYPDQTTFSANYKVNPWTKIFFTQRLASAAIMPIGDVSQTGFAFTSSRRETAVGVETKFGKHTALVSRYQLENGASGTDSFAVIGLQNRLPLSKELSLEFGFERGFHLVGAGQSFNAATLGFGWTPTDNFKASARYEFRDRQGMGQLFTIGAAGRISEEVTALSRFQLVRSGLGGHDSSSLDGMAALALRPLKSDRAGLLFSFTHRSMQQSMPAGQTPTRDSRDTLSSDGYYQATKNLELFGRFAMHFNANGQQGLPYVSTITFLTQERAQYRLTERFDWAAEARILFQPSSGTRRTVYGTELGVWAMPDLRFGLGYNFTAAGEPTGNASTNLLPKRSGFYFNVSSKLSSLFDLFGTSRTGLAGTSSNAQEKEGEQK